MKLSFPAAAAAAIALGAALPALAQNAPAEAPVVQPQTAAPAAPQATTPPVVRPAGSRGDCAWKSKSLTS